jgi:hypothetical protein
MPPLWPAPDTQIVHPKILTKQKHPQNACPQAILKEFGYFSGIK